MRHYPSNFSEASPIFDEALMLDNIEVRFHLIAYNVCRTRRFFGYLKNSPYMGTHVCPYK